MISLATLKFLTDITENNNREWFQDHKDQYEAARENMLEFTGEVIKALSLVDPYIDAPPTPKSA